MRKQIDADPLKIQKQIFVITWVLSCFRLENTYDVCISFSLMILFLSFHKVSNRIVIFVCFSTSSEKMSLSSTSSSITIFACWWSLCLEEHVLVFQSLCCKFYKFCNFFTTQRSYRGHPPSLIGVKIKVSSADCSRCWGAGIFEVEECNGEHLGNLVMVVQSAASVNL